MPRFKKRTLARKAAGLAKTTVLRVRNYVLEIDPELKLYFLSLGRGIVIGLSVHQIAKILVYIMNRRHQRRLTGEDIEKTEDINRTVLNSYRNKGRAERIRDLIRLIRGGELVTGSLLGPVLANIVQTAATDVGVSVCIAAIGTTGSYLINNPNIIRHATIGYIYSKALSKIPDPRSFTLVGKCLAIACQRTEDYLKSILFFNAPDREKRAAVKRYFRRVIREGLDGDKKLAFVLCVIALLTSLWFARSAAYYILIELLEEIYQEGEIPDSAYRAILRKLLRESLPVDPELGHGLVVGRHGLEEELISLDLSLFFNKTIQKV